ncbi:MAG: energy-coupled thiamine transporter ThiT [Clostridia bacterium]|nr:energy-coupled thiamine transporter ThiT [Clostridia bacterium]MBQ4167018.1 energy-coupled thiamine transporter ThiT [Clostridia bacterium]
MLKKKLSLALIVLLLCSLFAVFAGTVFAEEAPSDNAAVTATGAEDAAEEAEEEAEPVRFVLLEKLRKVDTKGWIFFFSALAIIVALIVYLATRKNNTEIADSSAREMKTTLILVQGALCIAMSFVLSYIKLFSMPTGGSITLASMLPLMVFANRHGVRWGVFAGLVYGLLQFFQKPEIYHWVQIILDYPVAFMLIGLGGLTKGVRNLPFSVLIGGTARFLAHFVSGAIFFGEYVMLGEDAAAGMTFGQMIGPNVTVSFLYNAPYMFADIAVCFIIALLPPFKKIVKKALKY